MRGQKVFAKNDFIFEDTLIPQGTVGLVAVEKGERVFVSFNMGDRFKRAWTDYENLLVDTSHLADAVMTRI